MDVLTFAEGLFEGFDIGDMGEDPEFDLGVVEADQRMAFGGDKGGADAAPFFPAIFRSQPL